MTAAPIVEAIRQRLAAAMPSTLRLVIDNAPEATGVTGDYATAAVQIDNTTQVSMPPRYRMTGALIVNVYVAAGSGDAVLHAHCDTIAAAFRGGAIASPIVTFQPAPTITGSVQRADGWGGRTLRIPFRADFT